MHKPLVQQLGLTLYFAARRSPISNRVKCNYRTFYQTYFLLILITCLSRYISLSFYRPALLLVHALVLLSESNTWHCWSIMPCCVAKCLDILVVLPPLARRSLLQVLQVTIPEVSSFFVKCSQTLDRFCRDNISPQCIACSSSAHLCSAAACVCDVIANLQVGYVCLQWQRSTGKINSGIVKGFC